MSESEIVDALNRLAELKTQRELLENERKRKIDKICAPFKAQIEKINKGIDNDCKPIDAKIKVLDVKIRSAVIEHETSVRGEEGDPPLIAVYSAGKVSWNDDFLLGMAVTYPKLKEGRTVGDPFVTIRKR